MDNQTLHEKYLLQGTAGYAIISKFYSRYADILARAGMSAINDVVHETFVSLSKTDFSQVRNVEHYVMRAVKLHCWSLLDKAIRLKTIVRENPDEPEAEEHVTGLYAISQPRQLEEIEGTELLVNLNLFKAQATPKEARLLNLLIDDTERSDIAELLGVNINTLDTNIRRLRLRLAGYLRGLGYTYKALERFE